MNTTHTLLSEYQMAVVLEVQRAVRAFVRQQAKSDVFFAKLLWSWYGEFDLALFTKYQLDMLLTKTRLLPSDMDHVIRFTYVDRNSRFQFDEQHTHAKKQMQ